MSSTNNSNDDDQSPIRPSFSDQFSDLIQERSSSQSFSSGPLPPLGDISQINPPHGPNEYSSTRYVHSDYSTYQIHHNMCKTHVPNPCILVVLILSRSIRSAPPLSAVEYRHVSEPITPNFRYVSLVQKRSSLSQFRTFSQFACLLLPCLLVFLSSAPIMQIHDLPSRSFSDTVSHLGDVTQPNPGFDKFKFSKQSFMPSSSEMFVNTSTQKATVEIKSTKTEELQVAIDGWGASGMATLRKLPKYHPQRKKFEQNASSIESLSDAAHSIQRCIRASSFQAAYKESPLSAKVQTPDHCEFSIDFWKAASGTEFYIDIQRRRGEHVFANMHMRKVLSAAKEGFDGDSFAASRSFNSEQLVSLESILNQAIPKSMPETPKFNVSKYMPETPKSNVLDHIHSLLTSSRLEVRKMGLQLLVARTDLMSTMRSGACSATTVVLAGKSPNGSGFAPQKATEIQNVLIMLIQSKEFQGDAERFGASETDMDVGDVEPFFAMAECSRDRPQYYEEFMNELHHMALTTLVQALEVADCFRDQFSQHVQDFREKYLEEGSLDTTLKKCIADVRGPLASQSLSIGYLACKALRILATSDNFLRQGVEEDVLKTRENIMTAMGVGKSSHAMLQRESENLYQVVYGNL
jgi:hypothetical protein